MSRRINLKSLLIIIIAISCCSMGIFWPQWNDVVEAQYCPPDPAAQATPEEINAAIEKALEWLAAQQNADGSWGYGCESVAYTGLAVLKFNTNAIDLDVDPLSPEYAYSDVVQMGLEFLMATHQTMPIGPEPAGNPDGDGDGIGVYWDNLCGGGHIIYNTSMAMMGIASSGHPELYGDVLQDAVDFLSWAQADPTDDDCNIHRGGWRYNPDECSSDNSNAGYASLALGYAQAGAPYGFGLTVPQFVKDELSIWIDLMQDDVNGDPDDGGSWYDPWSPWVNILKTGNLIYEMALVGDTAATGRVQDAIDYIERHWCDMDWCGAGWLDHRQAMFTMMKGFESLGITLIDTDNDSVADNDWYAEVSTHLVLTQNADGSWPGDCWGDQILSTAWAYLTLARAVPPVAIGVPVDITPGSCPNYLYPELLGNVVVAISSTKGFDVTTVDPATVKLAGVAPVLWGYKDVATPYEPYIGKENCLMCTKARGDGLVDLFLKFPVKELWKSLGAPGNGQCVVADLTGNLKEAFGGTPIVGEDVVSVVIKNKAKCDHHVCVAGGPLDPACSPCVADICAVDSYCCGVAWDSICVNEAVGICGISCTK